MSTINMQQLKKSYQDIEVIHGINIDIEEGEFIVLVGPSGCGKSTLLRMVAGLESITSGEVKIDDKVVNDLEPKDRGISMVFQNYALYPHMTVYENMAYGLKLMKMPKDEIDKRVQDVAKLLQIQEYLQRRPSNLSGGQRQSINLSRALLHDPNILVLDEPTSSMDSSTEASVLTRLADYLPDRTMIAVTHRNTLLKLVTRVLVMDQGNIILDSPPDQLK